MPNQNEYLEWEAHQMARNPATLVFVMGPTCAGKSTFLQWAKEREPEHVGLVEVGKMLRAKYPPSHFAGLNNPKHTADEAWALCESEVKRHYDEGRKVILVDGQPRDTPQVDLCMMRFVPQMFRRRFLLLDATLKERERRARATRSGEDLETLALPRLTNDMIAYYSVLAALLRYGVEIDVIETTNPNQQYTSDDLFEPLFSQFI